MQGGIYFNVAKLGTQKNGKPHGLPLIKQKPGAVPPQFFTSFLSMRLTTGTNYNTKTKLD